MHVHKNPSRPPPALVLLRKINTWSLHHPYHNPRKKIKRQDVLVVGRELKSHRLFSLPCFLSLRKVGKRFVQCFSLILAITKKGSWLHDTVYLSLKYWAYNSGLRSWNKYSSRNCPYHRGENGFDNKRDIEKKTCTLIIWTAHQYRMLYAISVSRKKLEKFLLQQELK